MFELAHQLIITVIERYSICIVLYRKIFCLVEYVSDDSVQFSRRMKKIIAKNGKEFTH